MTGKQTLSVVRRPEVPLGEAWISDQEPPFPVVIPAMNAEDRLVGEVIEASRTLLRTLDDRRRWNDDAERLSDCLDALDAL